MMKTVFRGLAILCGVVLLAPAARAADLPNFNKRGKNEKEFATKVGEVIVKKARTSVKTTNYQDYKLKEVKAGRSEMYIQMGYKGGVVGTKYTADITVHIDTSDKDKWEVLRIDYKDNNKSLVSFNRKNVDNLVKEFNDASK